MPKVFEWKGHRFHFFSNEGYPLEVIHIHVRKGPNRAKFWIKPCVSLEYNHGFSSKELNEFRRVKPKVNAYQESAQNLTGGANVHATTAR